MIRRLAAVLALGAALVEAPPPGPSLVDRVVAQVNADVILLSELEETAANQGENLRSRPARREFLDKMIDALLLKQEAQRLGLEPPAEIIAEAVDARLDALRESWPDPGSFEDWLRGRGTTLAELRQELREEEADAWRRRAVIVQRMGSPPADLDLPPQYELAQIVVACPLGASQAEAEAAFRECLALRQRVLDGEAFGPLAHLESDDGVTAPRGGDMGIVSSADLDPGIREALEALRAGEMSIPVRTAQGWHLFQVRRVISARQQWTMRAFDETRQRIADELRRRGTVQVFLDE